VVASFVCALCRPVRLPGVVLASEPSHCFGRSDHVVPGVLGGYRCSCKCRPTSFAPVMQTRFYDPEAPPGEQRGNCLSAVVASLMHLPIEAVPNFVQEHVDTDGEKDWWQSCWRFIHEQGYHAVLLRDETQPNSPFPLPKPGEPYLVSGISPRNPEVHHIVIYQDGRMLHDPHPDGTGLASLDDDFRWTIRLGTA
jgi:hypothetical protein